MPNKFELVVFLPNMKNDIITYELGKMGRGPIMPGEDPATVMQGRVITGDEIKSLQTYKQAQPPVISYLKLEVLDDLIAQDSLSQEKPKVLVKGNGVQSSDYSIPQQMIADRMAQVQIPTDKAA
jgi:hypothetical protein